MAARPVDLARAAANVAAAAAKGPKGEQKSSIVPELSGQGAGLPGWSHFMPPERELSEAWTGRARIETVDTMLNHSQVAALWQAVRLPTHRYIIELDPQDCDLVATDLIAADIDVPLLGADERRTGRRAKRFNQRRHFDRAFDALGYGHAVFETPGYIDQAGYWRLSDLPPVPQWTIDDQNSWEVDRKGQLIRVVQWGSNPPVKLDVDRLVVFTWQGRPGDPRGRSMLRPLYGAWLMHDRTMRVMGMSAERTGMGIPVGKVPNGAVAGAKEKMSALLGGMAAGHDSHLVIDTDGDIRHEVMLMGVTGQTPDLVGMLQYYDEAMARAMLAMLLQLGQTQSGSRALGGTFDDLLSIFHDTVVDWYCDTMTEQLVEPWVDRNRGEDAPAPRLVWKRRPDEDDEEEESDDEPVDSTAEEDHEPAQLPAPLAASRRRGPAQPDLARRQRAARTAFAAVAGRELRRDPSEVELAAAVDFAAIEAQHVATRGNVATALVAIRDELTTVAVEQVAAMDTVDPLTLADVLAPVLLAQADSMDAGPLVAILVALAAAGVHQVVGEAARQGVELAASIDYESRAQTDASDLMRRMARQVADSAASAARSSVAPGTPGWTAAQVVSEHLGSLTSAAAEQAAAGAASRAQNAGRAAAIEAGPVVSVIASEVLDQSVCGPCLLVDGKEYPSVAAALAEYPAGGYASCEGRERCRGLLIALFAITPEVDREPAGVT